MRQSFRLFVAASITLAAFGIVGCEEQIPSQDMPGGILGGNEYNRQQQAQSNTLDHSLTGTGIDSANPSGNSSAFPASTKPSVAKTAAPAGSPGAGGPDGTAVSTPGEQHRPASRPRPVRGHRRRRRQHRLTPNGIGAATAAPASGDNTTPAVPVAPADGAVTAVAPGTPATPAAKPRTGALPPTVPRHSTGGEQMKLKKGGMSLRKGGAKVECKKYWPVKFLHPISTCLIILCMRR